MGKIKLNKLYVFGISKNAIFYVPVKNKLFRIWVASWQIRSLLTVVTTKFVITSLISQ